MSLQPEILKFFDSHQISLSGSRFLVAFSGGPDSTALLWALHQLAPGLGAELHAIHIDHALDDDSDRRAARATEICQQIGVESTVLRRRLDKDFVTARGKEAAAREFRYQALESERRRLAARFTLTAHHADDQIETLFIRILHGTGIEGLAGIQPRQGCVVRPLLELRRCDLAQSLDGSGLEPVRDPTNHHLGTLRNRVRHLLIPQMTGHDAGLAESMTRLARSAAACRARLEARLGERLPIRKSAQEITLQRSALEDLPQSLWPLALSRIHRTAGVPYPPSTTARQELARQVRCRSRIGVDCGGGWRWEGRGEQLVLTRASPSTPGFAYTVEAPGECEIRELGLRFRLRQGEADDWMYRPSKHRAGLDLPIGAGSTVVVRSRREGDRVQPFGCSYTRRLKDVLIDARVPRQERSRLPLLEVNSRLAWVPGVTIDETFRVEPGIRVWIAELESI